MGMDPSKRPNMTPSTIAAPGPSEENKSTNVELTILVATPNPKLGFYFLPFYTPRNLHSLL
jgi:hypothetical protein